MQDKKEEVLTRGDCYISALLFEPGNCKCECVLSSNQNDCGIFSWFQRVEAFGKVFSRNIIKAFYASLGKGL